jgi:alpha-beta hydrolase superfamily lysophospholipase
MTEMSLPEASWLELEPDSVLTFLHRPASPQARRTAVLFCPPFGWEEMCSYRGLRTWAQTYAQSGYPSARLTLPATGDSGGTPHDPARLEAWIGAVADTASWLRQEVGAARLVALGIGLGGMLACLAAGTGAPIDDFILWGVPARGRSLLRELRAYSSMVSSRYMKDAEAELLPDGAVELTGYLLSAETATALESVDLEGPPPLATGRRRVLLLGRDRLPVDRRLRERFAHQQAEVTLAEGVGYSALMEHPQAASVPEETIRRTLAWLERSLDCAGPNRTSVPTRIKRSSTIVHGPDGDVRETPLRLTGELAGSFGVLADCPGREPAAVCAVWLNGGALHHTGPNRAWVEVARRWATRGVPTVRVDLRGVGESEGADERPLPDRSLYLAQRTEETLAVVDQLAERGLGDRFILGGLCSGAYWSLHAALADPRVTATMLINLYAFFWSAELVAERETERSLGALQGRAWRRLIRGELTSAQVRDGIQSLTPGRLRGGSGHPVQRAQSAQIAQALDQLRDQGTEALLLLSRGEGLYDQLQRQGVLDRLDVWPNLRVVQIPTRDHVFRAIWLQRHVHECLDRALDLALKERAESRSPGPR